MKKFSDVFKSIRFAKLDPQHDKSHKGGSQDDEEHYTVGEKEWEQQVKHAKKRAMQEEKKDKYDEGEYDREGDMAKSDLRSIMANAKRLHDMIGDSDNLPEWCQNKITVAEDYISTVANYMTAEMSESVVDKLAQRHSDLRKKSGLPHPDYYKELGKSYDIEDDKERLSKQSEIKKKYKVESYVPSPHAKPVPKKPKGEYERKVEKYLKKKYNKEEVEQIVEYGDTAKGQKMLTKVHKRAVNRLIKTDDKNMKEPDYTKRDLKTVRKHQATADRAWDRMSEEIENVEEGLVGRVISKVINKLHSANAKRPLPQASDRRTFEKPRMEQVVQEGRPSQRHPLEGHEYHKKTDAELEYIGKDAHKAAEAMKGHNTTAENKYRDQANDAATVRYFRKKSGTPDWYKKKYGHVKEEVEQLEEKNVPTSPEKWAQAKAQAKAKFDVYPSAYANGWAAKKYKEMGGGWKSVSEETISESRKTEIIKKLVKKKTNPDDKFEPNPVMLKTRDDRDH